jgi:hypothetical protein
MYEATCVESNNERSKWPPTEEQIKTIASSALNQSQDKDVKVLVYWENDPTLMIFEPIHFANTKYIHKKYEHNERSIEVIIGKVD